jgi:hypothetical protein
VRQAAARVPESSNGKHPHWGVAKW